MTVSLRVPALGASVAASLLVFSVACGGSPQSAAPATPATAPEAPATPAPAATTAPALIEPAEGSSSGHISLFRWSAVDGATGYRMRLNATTDGRVIWESPVITETETHLPNTVAMEPEGYFWTVTALKGDAELGTSPTGRFTVTP